MPSSKSVVNVFCILLTPENRFKARAGGITPLKMPEQQPAIKPPPDM